MNVYDELVSYLRSDETVEKIVFGRWWTDPNVDEINSEWNLTHLQFHIMRGGGS